MGQCRIFSVVALLLFPSLALAQQPVTTDSQSGSIVGVVTDASDALIPGASIQIAGDKSSDHATKTNEVGAFAINGLPAGVLRPRTRGGPR